MEVFKLRKYTVTINCVASKNRDLVMNSTFIV